MSDQYHGQDLDLGFVADEEGRVFAGPHSLIDLRATRREGVSPPSNDLAVVNGRTNLVQALIMRLMTERGELEALGHPDYGSRHHQLIGEPNTEGNRNLVKLYVLECLRQEPRLERIIAVTVRPAPGYKGRDTVEVYVTARVRGMPDPLSLVVPFSFAGALP